MNVKNKTLNIYKNLSIRHKLGVIYLIIGLLNSVFISYYFFTFMKESLIERTLNQLSSVKILKKEWIENYLNTQKKEVYYFSILPETQNSFEKIYKEYERDKSKTIDYQNHHSDITKSIDNFKFNHQYLNIWYVAKNGDIFYTSKSNNYWNKNIFTDSEFTNEFKINLQKSLKNNIVFDIEKITNLDSISYLFVSTPIYDQKQNLLGCILAKINPLEIQTILSQRTGMGQTGESYVVDNRKRIRSQSRFFNNIKDIPLINTIASQNALMSIDRNEMITDYRNVKVLSSYTQLKIDELKWALISEIDLEEAILPLYSFKNKMFLVIMISLLIIVGTTLYFSNKIIKSISNLNTEIKNLLLGKNPKNRIEISSNDELGEMNENINALFDRLDKTAKFAQEIGIGNFNANYQPASEDDKMGNSLIEMKNKLITLTQIIAQENKDKTLSLIQGQEKERRRISMELHDGVAQMLVALRFKTQELEQPSEIATILKAKIDDILQEIKRISINLMPNVLWDVGLEAAIKTLIKYNNIPVDIIFENQNSTLDLSNEIKFSVYRIIQEALNNILKHANASKISIIFNIENEQLILKIIDNGVGFNTEMTNSKEWILKDGLRNMKERAQMINGSISIESQKNLGSTISVIIPLNNN